MFNMTKIRATNGSGKSFYANHLCSNDYYSEHEKVQLSAGAEQQL